MIRRQLTLTTCVVALLTLLAAAFAQDDSVLQRYDLAIENLEVATASVPQDGAQARDELERALNALLTLSRDATSTNLVQAMERTFERTRVAVDNQSRTDMAVQTAVLAGGFSRLVMDSAYLVAGSGDLTTARTRLLHLADRLGFAPADAGAVTDAATAPALRLAFEAGLADAVAARLATVDDLAATDPDAAYVDLASAYGTSLLVQDSPRIAPSLNRDLVTAAQALVAHDEAALATATEAARKTLADLAAAARGADAGAAAGAALEPDQATAPAPAELPTAATPASTEGAGGTPQGDAATSSGGTAGSAADAPATAGAAEPVGAPAGLADANGAPAEAGVVTAAEQAAPATARDEASIQEAVAARLLALGEAAERAKSEELTRQLVAAGVGADAAPAAANRMLARGHDDLDGLLRGLEAHSAQLTAAVARGDRDAATTALSLTTDVFRRDVAPLLDHVDPRLEASTDALLTELAAAHPTQADAALVAARTALVRGAFAGATPTLADEVEGGVARYWSGPARDAVFLILGILAIFPLVLLNMAFGGSNRNWRLVGWGLFLLLVPVFYQAVVGLANLLGEVVDLSWLPDLARWSLLGGLTGQVAWVLLVLVALVLAIVGLRGICLQFGLLGGARKGAQPKATAVQPKGSTGHTTIDWDEEF